MNCIDLDIVLIIKPSDEFLNALKEYIRLGEYEIQKGQKDKATFYRFKTPKDDKFPIMLEFFSADKADLELYDEQHIIPITDFEGAKSLSAILLDDEYFAIIRKNAIERDGIFLINERALIPFKAKAYLEIKARGEDSKNWKKHRGDIINLAVNVLTEESEERLTGKVREQFVEFMNQFNQELTEDIITGACNQKISKETVVSLLERTFL